MTTVVGSVKGLRARGFDGFLPVRELWKGKLADIPRSPGVYVVLRSSMSPLKVRKNNPAFRFKGRDPTLPVSLLKARRPKRAIVLYIGKAGKRDGKATLFGRLGNYLRSGQGRSSAHWGGRAIWQLVGAGSLRVAWLKTAAAKSRSVERQLLGEFEREFGSLPFANRAR